MAVFEYTGIAASGGKKVNGVRDADNLKMLRAVLKREGIMLTSAQESREKGNTETESAFKTLFQRVDAAEISMMTRQLATLVNAGIPLVESVAALIEQVEKRILKRVLTQVRDRLNEGSSLAKALEAHPKIFSNLYVNMVAAGEASGTLEQVLERLADFMENQSKLRGKVGAALAYPALMMVIGTVLISIMMVVVVPKVTSIFASLDRALPWYTQTLIFVSSTMASAQMLGFVMGILTLNLVSRAMQQAALAVQAAQAPKTRAPEARREAPQVAANDKSWWIASFVAMGMTVMFGASVESIANYAIGILAGFIIGYAIARLVRYLSTPAGKLRRDTLMLKIPVLGTLIRMLAVSRFSRTLATLLRSGVPLLKAMDIVKSVLDNTKLEGVIDTAIGSIREGESIAGPLKRSGDFPPVVTHMIAVGEKSGQLEQMLENVARAYDAQVDSRVQALTSLLEPIMMIGMGGAVGFIAFSILMPLIQMQDFAGQ